MFGADKQAHTDALFKAVVAKVGPKNDRRHHQGVPVCGTDKLWDVKGKRESIPGSSCTTRLPLPLGTRCWQIKIHFSTEVGIQHSTVTNSVHSFLNEAQVTWGDWVVTLLILWPWNWSPQKKAHLCQRLYKAGWLRACWLWGVGMLQIQSQIILGCY